MVFNKLLINLNESIASIKLKHKAEVEEDEKFNDGAEHLLLQLEELVINELERQQYYAYCLAAHASFEGKLRRIISKIESEFDFKDKFSDIKGDSDLNKCRNYFSKVFGMDITKIKNSYDIMCNQKKIKNKIAHYNGIISIVEKIEISELKIKKMEFEMIEEKDMFQIKLNNDYLIDLIVNISSFYKQLIPAIEERYKTLKLN